MSGHRSVRLKILEYGGVRHAKVIKCGDSAAFGIGGNVDVLRFVEQALAAGEAFPAAFVFEEAVNAVQASVLGAAFDDERIPFEK